jgi:hypothetical protein
VYKTVSLIALLAVLAAPGTALAAPASTVATNTISATLIPDGTYTVKVEKVMDSKHIEVTMDNGAQTTLAGGRPTVDFSKVKPGDSVKLSLINGAVMVYLDLTSH